MSTTEVTGTKKFDLNIERILENWEVYHAVRELIANALDEQILTKTADIQIFKDPAGVWHIRDFGRGLRYEHLTQNENKEKLNSEEIIGKFGVGLKDALATLDRRNIKILIISKHGDISIGKTTKHGFDDVATLHAYIMPPSNPDFVGTEILLDGCNDEAIEKAKDLFLKFSGEKMLEKTKFGEALEKRDQVARIYINGVRVAEEQNFLFSYNITSLTEGMKKALNRERTNVGRTAYTDRIQKILMSSKSTDVANKLVAALDGYKSGKFFDEILWANVAVHACKILNAREDVIFFTFDESIYAKAMVDRAQDEGLRVILVPDEIKRKIKGQRDAEGNVIRDLGEYIREWNDSFEFAFVDPEELTKQERIIFDKTPLILKVAGGQPSKVKEILISETMRLDDCVYKETTGVWEPENGRIIIKRTQLKKLYYYAGTLLHEVAHAKSGWPDTSVEFEEALTKLLGRVSEIAIKQLNQP